MNNNSINVRVDSETKDKATKLLNELGLNMTSAINLFLKAVIRENGVPFELKINELNEKTLLAIEESEKISKDKNIKSYKNIEELRKALEV